MDAAIPERAVALRFEGSPGLGSDPPHVTFQEGTESHEAMDLSTVREKLVKKKDLSLGAWTEANVDAANLPSAFDGPLLETQRAYGAQCGSCDLLPCGRPASVRLVE